MMVTRIPQYFHKACFLLIWMTFTCDLKIDLIMFEPSYVKLIFFINLIHRQAI